MTEFKQKKFKICPFQNHRAQLTINAQILFELNMKKNFFLVGSVLFEIKSKK